MIGVHSAYVLMMKYLNKQTLWLHIFQLHLTQIDCFMFVRPNNHFQSEINRAKQTVFKTAAANLKGAITTKAGLTDFLSASALTSQENISPSLAVWTEHTKHRKPPQAERRLGGSRLVTLLLKTLPVAWGRKGWRSSSLLWEKKEKKTEQKALLSLALCVN